MIGEDEPIFKMQLGSRIYLLNSPIMPDYGTWEFRRASLDEVRNLVTWIGKDGKRRLRFDVVSAIGHKSTAHLLTQLLQLDEGEVPMSRIRVQWTHPEDVAVILRIPVRLPEGKVLSLAELKELCQGDPIEFGILRRLKQVEGRG